MAKVRAGELNRRITIQRPVPRSDKNQRPEWEDFLTVWAKVDEDPGSEEFMGDQEVTEQRVHFLVRYNTSITDRMRVKYEGTYYAIEGIAEVGNREGMNVKTLTISGRDAE